MDLSVWTWVVLVVSALLAGLAKTALPAVSTLPVAAFDTVLPARQSTAALVVLLLVADLVAVWTYRREADWAMLRRLVPPVLGGLVLGLGFLWWVDDVVMRRSIGAILIFLTILTLVLRRRGTLAVERANASPAIRGTYAALGGFTSMVANAGGPAMQLYFLAAGFDVIRFLATQAWFFFAINVTKLPLSLGWGLLHLDVLPMFAILAPIVLVGAFIGRRYARKWDKGVFDKVVIVLTIVSSLYLLR